RRTWCDRVDRRWRLRSDRDLVARRTHRPLPNDRRPREAPTPGHVAVLESPAMMLATIDSGLYKFFLVCHILVAIVGLGAVLVNGLYDAQARKRPGPPGRAIVEANNAVSTIAEYFIYAIPLFGFALIGLSDKFWKFSQTWIWLSLLLYVIALGISH